MYSAIDNSRQDESLAAYLKSPFVESCGWKGSYYCKLGGPFTEKKRGLYSALRARFKIKSKRPGRNTSVRASSSKKRGSKAHDEVCNYVGTGIKPKSPHARAFVRYLENELSHDLVASEVPVYIAELDCMTQVDLITKDYFTDELHMWELKTGRGANTRKHGPRLLKGVPNTKRNHWQLQRHYGWRGLVRGGVNIKFYNTHVVWVYTLKKSRKVEVKSIPPAPWTRKLIRKK